MSIKTNIKLSDALNIDGAFKNKLHNIIKQAVVGIVEAEYVKEAPVKDGDFRKGIQITKKSTLKYIVESTARSGKKNFNYPLALYTGTGKLDGKRDFGYTTGHVRANSVARGIGGIRPNKVADRAKKKSEPKAIDRFIKLINREL